MKQSDLLIIGGGIAGLCCAFYSARAGREVTVLEKDYVGAGASGGAAGMIVNPMFVPRDTPYSEMNSFARLNRMGYEEYPRFLKEIGVDAEDVGYADDGSYYLAFDGSEREKRKSYFTEMKKYDRSVEWLEPEQLDERIPAVSDQVRGGFYYKREARIIPCRLLDGLREAVEKNGTTIVEGEKAIRLSQTDSGSVKIETQSETYTASALIIAAGAWSGILGEKFGIDLKIQPRRGQMIRIRHDAIESIPVIKEGGRFLVPRSGDQVIVGATMDAEAGFSSEKREEATEDLLKTARRMIDFNEPPDVLKEWVGLRPYAQRKGGPFLGEVPGHPSVYLCAGHYKNGITQGPVTARMVVESVLGDNTYDFFDDYVLDR